MTEITVPKMGMSSTEIYVETWHVAESDQVSEGMALVDLESEKVIFTIDAEHAGVVAEILVQEGAIVGPGTVLGRLSHE